ncbi:MAG: class I SAM-dependent methyltransferase [Candidatus Omnitrophota bacterium]
MKKILPYKEFHSTRQASYMCLDKGQGDLVKNFNEEVLRGDVRLEYVPCLCGSEEFELVASVERHLMLQKTVLCRKCGLMQSNPRMTPGEYARFYSSDFYRRCYDSDNYLSRYEQKYTNRTGQHIFDEISKVKKIGPEVSVLECAAGGGWNLIPFLEKGAGVAGIDHSPSLVSLGREHGIDMSQGDVERIKGDHDVIIINHALEHFLDPVDSLKKIILHLKTGGLLYIAVPNIMNFCMGQLQNAHTYYFDPETLNHYCSLAGLRRLTHGPAQTIHMFSIFEISAGSCDGQDLANHSEEVSSYLRNMMIKHYTKKFLSRFHFDKIASKVYHSVFS